MATGRKSLQHGGFVTGGCFSSWNGRLIESAKTPGHDRGCVQSAQIRVTDGGLVLSSEGWGSQRGQPSDKLRLPPPNL